VVRQAHPGPGAREYRAFEEKLADARRYQEEEGILWPVLVDDLPGSVHQSYGRMADPTYLIGVDGRVSYYNMWTYAPVLHEAIEALLERGGSGVVLDGVDRFPHMLPALTTGWPGLEKGLPQSYVDLELATPGAGTLTWLGYQLRPVLGPLATRAQPLSPAARMALGAVAGLAVVGLVGALRKRSA
jgi:hypothetical protein